MSAQKIYICKHCKITSKYKYSIARHQAKHCKVIKLNRAIESGELERLWKKHYEAMERIDAKWDEITKSWLANLDKSLNVERVEI